MLPGFVYHLTHRCHDRQFLLRFARDRNQYRYRLRQAVLRSEVSLLFREPGWAEALAIGSEAFVGQMQARVRNRQVTEVLEGSEGWILREGRCLGYGSFQFDLGRDAHHAQVVLGGGDGSGDVSALAVIVQGIIVAGNDVLADGLSTEFVPVEHPATGSTSTASTAITQDIFGEIRMVGEVSYEVGDKVYHKDRDACIGST